MNKTTYMIAMTLLVGSVLPMIPSAAAYAGDQILTIKDNSRAICIPISDEQAAQGLEPSCATGTLTGVITSCTPTDADYATCTVEITGTLSLGPLMAAIFTSDAGKVQKVWDPLEPGPASETSPLTIGNVPRAGGEITRKAVLAASLAGNPLVDETENWDPIYVFPRDPTWAPPSDGCTSAAASSSGSSTTATASAPVAGVYETVTVRVPLSGSNAGGSQHTVMVKTNVKC